MSCIVSRRCKDDSLSESVRGAITSSASFPESATGSHGNSTCNTHHSRLPIGFTIPHTSHHITHHTPTHITLPRTSHSHAHHTPTHITLPHTSHSHTHHTPTHITLPHTSHSHTHHYASVYMRTSGSGRPCLSDSSTPAWCTIQEACVEQYHVAVS